MTRARVAPPLATALFLAGFTWLYVASSWVSDDAYISFRVVENLVHGFGLTYNPPERVQAFTHPLWLFVHVAGYLVSGEVFYTTLVIGFVCSLAALVVGARAFSDWRQAALWIVVVLSSKAWVDYTASGLENPLTHLLLAAFFVRYFRWADHAPPLAASRAGSNGLPEKEQHRFQQPAEDPAYEERLASPESSSSRTPGFPLGARMRAWVVQNPHPQLRTFTLLASLGFLNRPDTVLLFGPPLLWLLWQARRAPSRSVLAALVVGSLPAIAWEVFSVVYYGFPLPNTFYAKVATGVPAGLLAQQGLAYVLNSLAFDPLTLTVVGAATVVAAMSRRAPQMAIALALLLVLVYTVRVGGDHMGGRFFTAPFFVASLFLVRELPVQPRFAAVPAIAMIAYNIVVPLAPIKNGPAYEQGWPWRDTNGIQDERGYYHRATNLLLYNPLTDRPDHEWFRQGVSFAQGAERAAVLGSIGFFGYAAGPDKYVVDPNALSDPLLARLPASDSIHFDFYVGHFSRDVPDGYVESVARGENLVRDPLVRDLYEQVRRVTRGPIFSLARASDIVDLTLGEGSRIHQRYHDTRETHLQVAATHARFRTDIGVRDYERREIRARGDRAGYLVYGPRVPLRAGSYRLRWFGRYEEPPASADTGTAELWADGRELQRARLLAMPLESALADLSFTLPTAAREVEWRVFVPHGVRIVLERVALDGHPLAR